MGLLNYMWAGHKTCHQQFLNDVIKNDPTIADSYQRTLDPCDETRLIILEDVNGCMEYAILRREIYQDIDAFLLCFSIARRNTFDVLPRVSLFNEIGREELCNSLNRSEVFGRDKKCLAHISFYSSRLQIWRQTQRRQWTRRSGERRGTKLTNNLRVLMTEWL